LQQQLLQVLLLTRPLYRLHWLVLVMVLFLLRWLQLCLLLAMTLLPVLLVRLSSIACAGYLHNPRA
jgi:hypothetical protein